MADAQPPAPLGSQESREPTLEDLVNLCRALNEARAHYLIIGGFAIRAAGYTRNTMDVDLLVETGPDNERRLIQALMTLPDQAVRELKPGEVAEFGVVRIADEIVVDLMATACGITYAEGIQDTVFQEVQGVRIPFASPKMLLRTKQTVREKDVADRLFLRKLLEGEGVSLAPDEHAPLKGLRRWWSRIFSARKP